MTVTSAISPRPPAATSPAVLVPYAHPTDGERHYEALTQGSDATTKTSASEYAPLTSRNIKKVTAGLPMEGRVFRPVTARGGAAPIAALVATVASPLIPAVATAAGVPISPPNSLSPAAVLAPRPTHTSTQPARAPHSPPAERPRSPNSLSSPPPRARCQPEGSITPILGEGSRARSRRAEAVTELPAVGMAGTSHPRGRIILAERPPSDPGSVRAESLTPPEGRVVRGPMYDQGQLAAFAAMVAQQIQPPTVHVHVTAPPAPPAPPFAPESHSLKISRYSATLYSLIGAGAAAFGAWRQWKFPPAQPIQPVDYVELLSTKIEEGFAAKTPELEALARGAGMQGGRQGAIQAIAASRLGWKEWLPWPVRPFFLKQLTLT